MMKPHRLSPRRMGRAISPRPRDCYRSRWRADPREQTRSRFRGRNRRVAAARVCRVPQSCLPSACAARDDLRQLRLAGTRKAGKAYPLSFADCDGNPVHHTFNRDRIDLEHDRTIDQAIKLRAGSALTRQSSRGGSRRPWRRRVPPPSCLRSPPPSRDARRATPPPARRSRRSLRDSVNEQEGHASSFKLLDVLEQMLDLSRLEPRSRFIENDQSRAPPQRAGNFQHLPLADREVPCALTDVNLKSPKLKLFAALPANLIPTDHPKA